MRLMTTSLSSRWTALAIATSLLMPALAGCGNSGSGTTPAPGGSLSTAPQMAPAPQKVGLSGKQKVVLLAGAALLYYIYKKDMSNNAAAAAGAAKPQLYQSKNGGIYYRDPSDPKNKVIWVTAPSQPVAIPADQVQQYAPDYQKYQDQPAPTVPAGVRTVSAMQYDPSLASAGGPSGPGGPPGPRM